MKTIETVYNKLNTDKTELGTHKVELSMIDNISKLSSEMKAGVTKLKSYEKQVTTFGKELTAKYKASS